MQNEADKQQVLYSGPIVAAGLSMLLAFLTLMLSHHISRLTKGLDKTIHSYGHWIPGSTGSGPTGSIGSYSGKETLALIVWLGSWLIFHFLWRRLDFPLHTWTRFFVFGLIIISLGFIHPLADPIVMFLAGLCGLN